VRSRAGIVADVGVSTPPKKSDVSELSEKGFAGNRIETPQSLDLRLGQMHARIFQVLGSNELEPVRNGRIGGEHMTSPGFEKKCPFVGGSVGC
jgi:hypothetical protein